MAERRDPVGDVRVAALAGVSRVSPLGTRRRRDVGGVIVDVARSDRDGPGEKYDVYVFEVFVYEVAGYR